MKSLDQLKGMGSSALSERSNTLSGHFGVVHKARSDRSRGYGRFVKVEKTGSFLKFVDGVPQDFHQNARLKWIHQKISGDPALLTRLAFSAAADIGRETTIQIDPLVIARTDPEAEAFGGIEIPRDLIRLSDVSTDPGVTGISDHDVAMLFLLEQSTFQTPITFADLRHELCAGFEDPTKEGDTWVVHPPEWYYTQLTDSDKRRVIEGYLWWYRCYAENSVSLENGVRVQSFREGTLQSEWADMVGSKKKFSVKRDGQADGTIEVSIPSSDPYKVDIDDRVVSSEDAKNQIGIQKDIKDLNGDEVTVDVTVASDTYEIVKCAAANIVANTGAHAFNARILSQQLAAHLTRERRTKRDYTVKLGTADGLLNFIQGYSVASLKTAKSKVKNNKNWRLMPIRSQSTKEGGTIWSHNVLKFPKASTELVLADDLLVKLTGLTHQEVAELGDEYRTYDNGVVFFSLLDDDARVTTSGRSVIDLAINCTDYQDCYYGVGKLSTLSAPLIIDGKTVSEGEHIPFVSVNKGARRSELLAALRDDAELEWQAALRDLKVPTNSDSNSFEWWWIIAILLLWMLLSRDDSSSEQSKQQVVVVVPPTAGAVQSLPQVGGTIESGVSLETAGKVERKL